MDDLVRRAQRLIDEDQYLTLAAADENGRQRASTVWYTARQRCGAPVGHAVEVIWLSGPAAQDSRNLLPRPEVGTSIFDSTQPAGTGDGLQFGGIAGVSLAPS